MEALAKKIASLEARLNLLEKTPHKFSSKDSGNGVGDGVLLNVGGKQFTSTIATLRQAGEGTFLHCVASSQDTNENSGRIPFRKDGKGAICVDRSFKHFAKILDFLRNGPAFVRPKSSQDCDEILAEAQFYGLDDLATAVDRLRMPWFNGECAVRRAETTVQFTAKGRISVLVTVPDPRSFHVSMHVEVEKRSGPKRARGVRETDWGWSASPWYHISVWSLALVPHAHAGHGSPVEKTVLLPVPPRSWCPNKDDFTVAYSRGQTSGRRLSPGQRGPSKIYTGNDNLASLETLDHWKFELHSKRPEDAKMPPQPEKEVDVVLLSKLFEKRRHLGDRLELWPETALLSARIPDLGTHCVQLVACSASRIVDAGVRIRFVCGTIELHWVLFDDNDTPKCMIVEQNGVSTYASTPPRPIKTLSLRLSQGAEGEKRLRLLQDGANFFACDAPEVLSQQLLVSLDWDGYTHPELSFDEGLS